MHLNLRSVYPQTDGGALAGETLVEAAAAGPRLQISEEFGP